jgi:hypothetical protein
MVSVSYTTFQTPMDLTTNDISEAETETLIDAAINHVNAIGNLSISNMSGAAGSMTVTLTSAQWGVVFYVARAMYYSGFKGVVGASVGGGATSVPVDILLDPQFNSTVRRMSRNLVTRSFVTT